MDYTADHLFEGKGGVDLPSRIDAAQRLGKSRHAAAEPPRHAVHRRHHQRRGPDQRTDAAHDLRQCRPLDRNDDKVLNAQFAGVLACRSER
ncbi:hypothetical protein D3C72_2166720 [compost metagenome]